MAKYEWSPLRLSLEQLEEIERRWKGAINPAQIDRVAEGLALDLSIWTRQPNEVRSEIRDLRKLVAKLRRHLQPLTSLSNKELSNLVHLAEFFDGFAPGPPRVLAAIAALNDVQELLESAEARLPRGTSRKEAEYETIGDLIEIIERAGFPANRSKRSPLPYLLDAVLNAEAVRPLRKGRLGSAESVLEHYFKEKSRHK